MLYLDFSCTQRLMTPPSPDIKDSSEDRVYAVLSSIFLMVDASVHLFAATYKGFIWVASQISRKNPPDYYKEAYPHLIKALRCISMIPFGSLLGFRCPNAFQSKKLQEYLGWKSSLKNTSEAIENKTLKKELQSKNEEIKRLKSQIDSLTRTIPPNTLQDSSQHLEMGLVSDETTKSAPLEDAMSLSSEDEFVDTEEGFSNIEKLEKELQSKNEEIKRLKPQIGLLNKILCPLKSIHPYNQILSIQKALNKSIEDTPTVYEYLSDSVKQEIDDAFQNKFKMKFFEFCTQANPDIDSAFQTLTGLLRRHDFSLLFNVKEASISAFIKLLA